MGVGVFGLAKGALGLLGRPAVQNTLLGGGLLYGAGTMFSPNSVQQSILDKDRLPGGGYDASGVLARAYRYLDSLDGEVGVGLGSSVSNKALASKQIKRLKAGDTYTAARSLNIPISEIEPLPNETEQNYKIRMIPLIEDAQFNREDNRPGGGAYQRGEREAAKGFERTVLRGQIEDRRNRADRNFRLDSERMQESIDSRVDANDLLRMQLAQSDSQFARQLAFDEKRDSRERRDSLAAAIASLGSAIFI